MDDKKLFQELYESEECKKWTQKLNQILEIKSSYSNARKQESINILATDLLFLSLIIGTVYPVSDILEEWDRSLNEYIIDKINIRSTKLLNEL